MLHTKKVLREWSASSIYGISDSFTERGEVVLVHWKEAVTTLHKFTSFYLCNKKTHKLLDFFCTRFVVVVVVGVVTRAKFVSSRNFDPVAKSVIKQCSSGERRAHLDVGQTTERVPLNKRNNNKRQPFCASDDKQVCVSVLVC